MSRLYARITQRNIDICSTERQSRYGFFNFFVQSIKENHKVLGLFEYQPLGFWNSLSNEIKRSSSLEF